MLMAKKSAILLFLLIFLTSCSNNPNGVSYPVKPGNEAFMAGNGSEIGVLLAHGFEASPNELKGLAQYLADRNITVLVVRLKGHGTDIKELDNTKWQEWYEDYENGLNELSNKTKKVVVARHSLGGALALYLAEKKDTDGVVSLAAPTGLQDNRAEFAWLIKYFKKYEGRELKEEEKNYHYGKYSAAGVEQLVKLIKKYKKDLPKITEPVLIIQLSDETKIEPSSAIYINQKVQSRDKKLVIIPAAGHSLFNGDYKNEVYKEIYDFVKRV